MRHPLIEFTAATLVTGALCTGGTAHGAIEDSLTAGDDPQQNLVRLVSVLRQLQTNNQSLGDLAETTSILDRLIQRSRVLTTLRTLLPDVVRHHALRERRPFNTTQTRKSSQKQARRSKAMDYAALSNYGGDVLNWADSSDTFEASYDLWLQAYADDASQDDADGLGGFDSSGNGVAVGIDYSISERWSVGVNLGRGLTEVTTDIFGDDEVDSLEYGASLSYTFDAHTLMFSLNQSDAETERLRYIVLFPDSGPRFFGLSSEIDSGQTSASLAYSGYFELNPGFSFAPFISLSHAELTTDDYVETGNGTMALAVTTDDEVQVVGATGVTFAWDRQLGENWLLTPSVGAAFEHDFKADATQTLSRFRNTPLTFATQGYGIEENRWRFSAGLGFYHRNEVAISLSYEGHRKGDYSYDAAIISFQVKL
jgi:outer membrane autotransporter protein